MPKQHHRRKTTRPGEAALPPPPPPLGPQNLPPVRLRLTLFLVLLFAFCPSPALFAQETELVYPVFDRYETFNDAYVAPGGRGFLVGTCHPLYRTTDDGRTWTSLDPDALPRNPTNVQCRPGTNCAEVFLTANGGLHRSTDGGDTWTVVGAVRPAELNFSLPGSIYGTAPRGRDLSVSTDNGLSWTNLPLPDRAPDAVLLRSATEFGVAIDSFFYRSDDAGATWTAVHQFDRPTVLNYLDADGNYYVETQGAAIHKSTDGGTSWTQLNPDAHQYSSYFDLYKDAEDSLHVISFNGVRFSSGDDGASWESAASPRFQTYRNFRRAEGRLFAAGTGLTIFVGDADYSGMRSLLGNEALPLHNIVFHDAQTGYGFGNDGKVLRTTDGGASWAVISQIGRSTDSRPKVAPNGDLYGARSVTELVRSTDQGASWQTLSEANDALAGGRRVFDVLPNGETVVMTNQRTVRLDADGRVLSAADGGHPSTSGGTFDLKMIDADLGFIVRWGRADIYRTADGGLTWDTIPALGTNGFFNWFEVAAPDTFLIGNGDMAWRSTDAGLTWDTYGTRSTLGRFFVGDDEYGFDRNSLYRSRDGGVNWEEKVRLCQRPRAMTRRPGTNELYFAQLNGVERLDLDALLTSNRPEPVRTTPLLSWPNPTAGPATVALPAGAGSAEEVLVVDLAGRGLTVPWSATATGVELDLSGLPAGVYVVRLATDAATAYQTRIVRR